MCQLIYKPTKEPMNTIILMTISFGGPVPPNDIYIYIPIIPTQWFLKTMKTPNNWIVTKSQNKFRLYGQLIPRKNHTYRYLLLWIKYVLLYDAYCMNENVGFSFMICQEEMNYEYDDLFFISFENIEK